MEGVKWLQKIILCLGVCAPHTTESYCFLWLPTASQAGGSHLQVIEMGMMVQGCNPSTLVGWSQEDYEWETSFGSLV